MTYYNQRAHDEYMQLGAWKCSQSPTGAHFWIGDCFVLKCKHCRKTKNVVEQLSPIQIAVRMKKKNAESNPKL